MAILDANLYLNHFSEFDGKKYYNFGYNTLLLDIDNTLSPYYEEKPNEEVIEFINNLKDIGFNVILISNNTKERVEKYNKYLNCKYYAMSLKPLPLTYKRIIEENNLDKDRIICLGDQLITDVFGGKLSGLYTIYVKPIVDVDNFTGKITRTLERIIFKINEKM